MLLAPVKPILAPVKHVVWRRGADHAFDSVDGWEIDQHLRCDQVTMLAGAKVGLADFAFIPTGITKDAGRDPDESFEHVLGRYGIDDQVRVRAYPPISPGDMAGATGRILFEGVLQRHSFQAQASQTGGSESVRFTAFPMPLLAARAYPSLVRGRWIFDPTVIGRSNAVKVIDSPMVPAVFNFRGRRNRFGPGSIYHNHPQGLFEAPAFTHDDDTFGRYWTLRDALASLVMMWILGPADCPIPRCIDIESQTLAQLKVEFPESRPAEFEGFDEPIPEVSVHGLNVLAAIEAVCKSVGYEFAIEPHGDEFVEDSLYVLRVWKRNTGREAWLDLAPRVSSYDPATGAADLVTENNASKTLGMKDGAEIANDIDAVGPSFIECKLVLKPLWRPIDVTAGDPNDDYQNVTDEDLANVNGYAGRHVEGGAAFNTFGYVGRNWGIDCTGHLQDLYPDAVYLQQAGGFDFVTALDLAHSPIADRRTALGITGPIVWAKRNRQLLPLKSFLATLKGAQYLIEVSEDEGATWASCPINFTTLEDECGIRLTVKNLAEVNLASILQGEIADADKSWWKLILQKKLLFRISAVIEADQGNLAIARNRACAGSRYSFARRLMLSHHEELWVQPNATPWNAAWNRETPKMTAGANASPLSIEAVVKREQDALEDCRFSVTSDIPIMDLDRYRLGDRIMGIRGRDYSFATANGAQWSYPGVMGITLTIGVNGQSIKLSLQDLRMTGAPN